MLSAAPATQSRVPARAPPSGTGGGRPAQGILRLSTTGSTFDTLLAVYRGSRLMTLHRLADDDDSGQSTASALRIEVYRRRAYRIAVDGFRGRMREMLCFGGHSPPRAD